MIRAALAHCEHCKRARPLFLYRLRSRGTDGRGGMKFFPCSALCERCAARVGALRWFIAGKQVAA